MGLTSHLKATVYQISVKMTLKRILLNKYPLLSRRKVSRLIEKHLPSFSNEGNASLN